MTNLYEVLNSPCLRVMKVHKHSRDIPLKDPQPFCWQCPCLLEKLKTIIAIGDSHDDLKCRVWPVNSLSDVWCVFQFDKSFPNFCLVTRVSDAHMTHGQCCQLQICQTAAQAPPKPQRKGLK